MSTDLPPVRLTLWRDRDPEAMRIPGMYLGEVDVGGDPLDEVARLAAGGACLARLHAAIDLSDADGAAAVAGLVVVRELTAHAIAVDWTLRPPAGPWDWRPLGHLHPPTTVPGGDGLAAAWSDDFRPAKFGYRHGPGFIEVRDHRADPFRRLVIRNPRYEQVIEPLLRGVATTDQTEAVTARYHGAGLLHRVGRYVWWTPYRVRHSPHGTGPP
ncbi:hypothetical protein B4N89_43380 [Embleya scabrispora]|uniref:Uncharacterized protein n=1 Tax=Embleya scabrispora TaxID=159449 RepID=A0A1T3NKJ1_9ACTN|nr:DUF5825 family protein [Embleya scabrispora]OPC77363.1 hypothetical protein B4N89_43380 [Embleya scabrispora]